MENDFKKGEFNLVQVIKLTIMAIGGSVIAGSLIYIAVKMTIVIRLLELFIYSR